MNQSTIFQKAVKNQKTLFYRPPIIKLLIRPCLLYFLFFEISAYLAALHALKHGSTNVLI